MSKPQPRSPGKRALGLAVLALGCAIAGYGAHYLFMNGNCSSTGYASYGPVPVCSGPEWLYIVSAFFIGPAVVLGGWGMTQISGLLWPVFCVFLGTAMVTIRIEPGAAPGAKTFGLAVGACFFALAVVSLVFTGRRRLRAGKTPAAPPGLAAPAGLEIAPAAGLPVPGTPLLRAPADVPAPARGEPPAAGAPEPADPLDRIAKLAKLRDSGALTEQEFQREKAKLLAQM